MRSSFFLWGSFIFRGSVIFIGDQIVIVRQFIGVWLSALYYHMNNSFQEAGWYKTLTFCNYAPGGNYLKMSLYTEGEACSKFEEGMTCDDGLCVE